MRLKKKFLILVAAVILGFGLRLRDSRLLHLGYEGTLSVYHSGGAVTVMNADDAPLISRWREPVRLDIAGEASPDTLLDRLSARELWRERAEDVDIVYGYTDAIPMYETVRGMRVNVMIASSARGVSVGCPLLMGSY